MRLRTALIAWATAGALAPASAASAAPLRYAIEPDRSELGYRVQTKVFLLLDEGVAGQARPTDGLLVVGHDGVSGWVSLPAAQFRSGVASRDKNVSDILQSARFPTIRFELESLTGFAPDKAARGMATAAGRLRVRDRSVALRFPVEYRVEDGRLILTGDVQTTFSAFGLSPPVLGFIAKRSPDVLTLHAHLTGHEIQSTAAR
jgi:polyisoprenoid-binding protein YceI